MDSSDENMERISSALAEAFPSGITLHNLSVEVDEISEKLCIIYKSASDKVDEDALTDIIAQYVDGAEFYIEPTLF